jgi:ribonucleoside-diphosphate reductase subunit M2
MKNILLKWFWRFLLRRDGLIIENLGARFMTEVKVAEIKAFYGFQIAMENIHSAKPILLLIETYVKDKTEKIKLFNAIDNFPCIKKKADWCESYINNIEADFATRLVAFACVEGIFFQGLFVVYIGLKKRGLMAGLTFSNELISRDEALHTEFAVLLYSKLQNKLSKDKIKEIIKEAVEIEQEFICDALPCRLIGMNSQLMSKYIEFVADRLSVQLGAGKIYETKNPFDFMEMISIEGKTNFFEKRVGEYALATKDKDKTTFDFDADF